MEDDLALLTHVHAEETKQRGQTICVPSRLRDGRLQGQLVRRGDARARGHFPAQEGWSSSRSFQLGRSGALHQSAHRSVLALFTAILRAKPSNLASRSGSSASSDNIVIAICLI
jgi:hypothetical protein